MKLRYTAVSQLQRFEDGKMKVLVKAGETISKAKYEALPDRLKDYYLPENLETLIAEVQAAN